MSHRRRHRPPRAGTPRRGFALIDTIIGGVLLGVGLTVLLTITGRALSMQTAGEKRLTAAWLADELLTMVLVEGPDNFAHRNDTSGRFGSPFEEFTFDVGIESTGRGAPYRVSTVVAWSKRPRDAVQVETLIALRLGEPEQLREPLEPVDRDARYFDDDDASR